MLNSPRWVNAYPPRPSRDLHSKFLLFFAWIAFKISKDVERGQNWGKRSQNYCNTNHRIWTAFLMNIWPWRSITFAYELKWTWFKNYFEANSKLYKFDEGVEPHGGLIHTLHARDEHEGHFHFLSRLWKAFMSLKSDCTPQNAISVRNSINRGIGVKN